MSGGAGHIADMNNRMKQNRSIKTSNKPKFKSNNRDLNFSKGESEKLTFKKVSEEELTQIKNEIRRKSKSERKKERRILILMTFVLIIILILISFSCKNERKNDELNSKVESELKADTHNGYNELANPDKREIFTISDFNTDNSEIENIKRPEKTIIRNLAIDTTQAFGIWTEDPNRPHADFWLTAKNFLVADYDGDGHMPYILDGNKITIYYNDFVQKGIITSTKNDTMKIKWADFDKETKYVKFEN